MRAPRADDGVRNGPRSFGHRKYDAGETFEDNGRYRFE